MAYELYILKDDSFVALDLGDEKPPMTYQINNLNEFKSRNASYSQSISLPVTSNNCEKLGLLNVFESDAEPAYVPYECKLLFDGIDLTPFTAELRIISFNSIKISAQIVSTVTDLFALLESINIADYILNNWDFYLKTHFQQELEFMRTANADTSAEVRMRFPYMVSNTTDNFNAMIHSLDTGQKYEVRQNFEVLPCLRFIDLVRVILKEVGYDLATNIEDNPEALKDYIVCGAAQEASPWSANASGQYQISPNRLIPPYFDSGDSGMAYWTASIRQNPTSSEIDGYSYYALHDMSARLQIWLRKGSAPTNTILCTVIHRHFSTGLSTTIYNDVANFYNTEDYYSFKLDETVEMHAGDMLSIDIRGNTPGTSETVQYEISFYSTMYCEGNGLLATGFKTFAEVVKTFMQTYALSVDIPRVPTSDRNGLVRLYSLDELYSRRDNGIYKDWSGKIDYSKDITVKYTLGSYAQQNIIENKEFPDPVFVDTGVLSIDNKTLEKSKSLLTSALQSVRPFTYSITDSNGARTVTLAQVPVITPETQESPVGYIRKYTRESAPALVRIDEDATYQIAIYQGATFWGLEGIDMILPLPIATVRSVQGLIDNYYNMLVKVFQRPRTVELSLKLDTIDIQELDFYNPIYIKSFGALFYAMKITNYIENKLTKVELVKL